MRVDAALKILLAGLLLAAAPLASAAPDRQAADDAFNAGDNAKALALYEEILAADPNDVHALYVSGKLLSWTKDYDGALARYDRALTREPGNTEVLLERGKVLLWSGRYDEAIPAFDRVLRIDPTEPWALCGTAQSYAWRGRGREARPYYEKALVAKPDLKEAHLGLAYIELGDGNTSRALAHANALAAIDPTDPEVAELQRQVKRARAPWVQAGWDGADDSDQIQTHAYRLDGGLSLPGPFDLRFGYAHGDVEGPDASGATIDAQTDSLFGVLGWRPRVNHRGELRLGATKLTDKDDGTRTIAIGGVSYSFPMASWTGYAALAHDPFVYSPRIIDNEVDITSLAFGAYGNVSRHARIETNAGYADFSDDNTRVSADVGAWYVWPWAKRSILLGGVVRFFDYSKDLDNGYFDPESFRSGALSFKSYGSIGESSWTYETSAEAGVQSFTLNGAQASAEPLWSAHGLVARPLPHGFSFQIFADFGNSSAASGPGYTWRSGGFRLRYTIGG